MSKTCLIIFDCDGVLVDSELIACGGVAESLTSRGLSVSAKEIAERYIGISAAAMFQEIETQFGLVLTQAERIAISQRVDRKLADSVLAMPGIARALAGLPAHFATCVASSGTFDRIRGSLTHAGLWEYFEGRVFSATQVVHGKPEPDLFLLAAARMGYSPACCVVIEDSIAGIRAATAAKMKCLGFLGGSHIRPGHAEKLMTAGAAATFEAMAALAPLAERLALS